MAYVFTGKSEIDRRSVQTSGASLSNYRRDSGNVEAKVVGSIQLLGFAHIETTLAI